VQIVQQKNHFINSKKQNIVDTLSYRTLSSNKTDSRKEWLLIDAEGKTLGRLAAVVAIILRGKHKTNYTPHADCGDNVVVINAEKVVLTGHKWDDKKYTRYTGYPGGQILTPVKDVLKKKPEFMVEKAVKGMLPKNRLGRELFRNLHVYVGAEHQNEAQKPRKTELNSIK
jgi:large subunit ribosomal protein L13